MGSQPVSPFIESLFEETLGLLAEARDYAARSLAEGGQRPLDERLRVQREQFRVTARLAHALAWLLYRKAMAADEPEIAAGGEATGLDGGEACLDRRSLKDGSLPKGLRGLLRRSYALYRRIQRLDAMEGPGEG